MRPDPRLPRPAPPAARRARVATPAALGAALVALALGGCDELDDAFDCVDGDRPAFGRSELPSPVLNELYRESVTVSIENTSSDDSFEYDFDLEGELPPGIEWYESGRRTVTFEGTPIELGTWMPTLGVRVRDGGTGVFDDAADTDGLCRTQREATYTIQVVSP